MPMLLTTICFFWYAILCILEKKFSGSMMWPISQSWGRIPLGLSVPAKYGALSVWAYTAEYLLMPIVRVFTGYRITNPPESGKDGLRTARCGVTARGFSFPIRRARSTRLLFPGQRRGSWILKAQQVDTREKVWEGSVFMPIPV